MKPTPTLFARLRFSTKDVGKGFYRGNRTGSMGAHTPRGGYLIDYRKVRNFKVPELKDFKLTPYVTREIGEVETPEETYEWEREYDEGSQEDISAQDLSVARRTRAMKFISQWRQLNPAQFQEWVDHQVETSLRPDIERYQSGEQVEILEKLILAEHQKRKLADA